MLYWQLIWPNRFIFSILLSAFFTSSLLIQFTFSLTTSGSSVLGSLLFSSFINFSKYFFHLFNTASEFAVTLPFSFFITLTCCTSFPVLSLCLANRYYSFSPSFVFNLAYKLIYARLFAIATAFFTLLFFVDLFTLFISYFIPCFLCLFLFFYALLNFIIPPPCLPVSFSFLKCHSQYSFSCTVSAVFLSTSVALSDKGKRCHLRNDNCC